MPTKYSPPNASEIRVLKSASCPSLSGKSKLSYELGGDPESKLYIRVSKNAGGGHFSDDWVPWEQLERILANNGQEPITCFTFGPLFEGRSVNTSGFLLAALKNEGLVQRMEENKRCYEGLDGTAFFAKVKDLLGSAGAAPTARKAAPKKRANKA
jgi:hypothetical protein